MTEAGSGLRHATGNGHATNIDILIEHTKGPKFFVFILFSSKQLLHNSHFLNLSLIGGKLLYNIVLVSAIH